MTRIIYQGEPWAYMHQASLGVEKLLNIKINEIIWLESFEKCWNTYEEDDIMVLAIENSSAGSIYENLYKFLDQDVKIIGEYNLEINHCLCSLEKNIEDVTKVYSHFKALPQCYKYLKSKRLYHQEIHPDTAGSAKMISETKEPWSSSICSELAWNMYGLNILDRNIQDQKWNTTRFVVIVPKNSKIIYKKRANKISILFEAKDIPSSLYKCLWVFAKNNVNLSKIESLPNITNPFSYLFWLDFEGRLNDKNVVKSLEELKLFTSEINILGEY